MTTEKTDIFDAARAGQTQTVCQWLDDGGDIEIRNERGDVLVLLAVYYARVELVEELIRRGATVDARNNNGQRALAGACFKGFKSLVEILLNAGAEVNENSPAQKSPLMYAASYEHVGIVKLLLAAGAEANAKVDGKTALDLARDNLAHEVVPVLEPLTEA